MGLLSAYLALYPMLFTYLAQRFQVQSAVILPRDLDIDWNPCVDGCLPVFRGYNLVIPKSTVHFRHCADLWGHGDDILTVWAKCGHFNLILHYRKNNGI